MIDFFAMGGYALYVWGAFGVSALLLLAESLLLQRRNAAIRKHLRLLAEATEEPRA